MRKVEAGCIAVPRKDGTFFSTIYDQDEHSELYVSNPVGYARMVVNFTSQKEAEIFTPAIIEAINETLYPKQMRLHLHSKEPKL